MSMLGAFKCVDCIHCNALGLGCPSLAGLTTWPPPAPPSRLHRLLVNSGVVRALIRGLAGALLSGHELLLGPLTATLLASSYLPASCRQLVEQGLLSCLPTLLGFGYKHDVTAMGVELLWNLLEQAPSETKAQISELQPSLVTLAGDAELPPLSGRRQLLQQKQQQLQHLQQREGEGAHNEQGREQQQGEGLQANGHASVTGSRPASSATGIADGGPAAEASALSQVRAHTLEELVVTAVVVVVVVVGVGAAGYQW